MVSIGNLSAVDKKNTGPVTLRELVPNRSAVTAPAFGAWLKAQRGVRSLEAIAIQIRPLVEAAGLKVDQSLIYKFEHGRIPSWPVLAAFSRVYKTSIPEVLSRLASAMEFPGASDLLRHGGGADSDLGENAIHAGTATRVFDGSDVLTELAAAAGAFQSLAAQCTEWSNRLVDLAAKHGVLEGQTASDRVHGARKTRARGAVRRRPADSDDAVARRRRRA